MYENKYPEYIMRKLRQNNYLEQDDTSLDEELNKMDSLEAFNRVLHWEGLTGYTDSIFEWLKDCGFKVI